ncbi:hypothetical protein [Archangium primigenium]|uniref:hypothetical protein n=1 Tax=[Archangium] primigenium TaxID=2792470 RepID=UPI00195840B3|nr:hypothetical protein [Archangium primigenium]MBM7114654.1 hypothetical protein [Archangium primigenium]
MRTPPVSCLLVFAALVGACHHDIPSLDPRFVVEPPLRPTFLPPEDGPLVETVRGASGAQEVELTTVSLFTPEAPGWLLTQRVTRSRYTRAGVEVRSWVDEALQRAPLRLRLAADGTFVRLEAPDAARAALRELSTAGWDVSALERVLAPDALEARTRREWEVTYGGVYGRTWVPGQRGHAVGGLSLADGEVTYLLERTLTGTRLTEQGEVLVFALRCLGPPGDTSPPEVWDVWRSAGEPPLTPGVECDGEQWLGKGRFLPVRRTFTLRGQRGAETWSWWMDAFLEPNHEP